MSGPIVRKYGFPNHESIFGKKEIEHGVDEATQPEGAVEATASEAEAPKKSAPKKGPAKKKD